MPFSLFFIVLILSGIVPAIALAPFGLSAFGVLLYNLVLIVLLIADRKLTPKPDMLYVSRKLDEKLSMGAENKIYISVYNKSKYKLNIKIRQEIPEHFKYENDTVQIVSMPLNDCGESLTVIPQKRGSFGFDVLNLRYNGILRLAQINKKVIIAEKIKVYPNIKDLRRFSFAAVNKTLILQGKKRVKSFFGGSEFESLKEYTEEDDYRNINWLATARTQKLISNKYQPEKNQNVVICLDSSRLMNSEINNIKKLDYAINSAFVLTDFVLRKGDMAGFISFDMEVGKYIKPGKGDRQFQLIADTMYDIEEKLVSSDLNTLYAFIKNTNLKRSLFCIFTDIYSVEEASSLSRILMLLSKSHLPLVITIDDPRIRESSESIPQNLTNFYDKVSAIKLMQEREKIRQIFKKSGILSLDIYPDRLSVEIINKYMEIKSKNQI